MKTKTEIQDHISNLNEFLENGFITIAPPKGIAKENMKSWVRALEWVIK